MAGTTTMPVARDWYRPPRSTGRIQAAWTEVMDDEHNEIDQADLDQFAAATLAEFDKTVVAKHEEATGRAEARITKPHLSCQPSSVWQ